MNNLTITVWNVDDRNENGMTSRLNNEKSTLDWKCGVRGRDISPPYH